MTFDLDLNAGERLTGWLRTQIADADDVRVDGVDRVNFGHSAEMMVLTIVTGRGGRQTSQDVVIRLRPKPPALLEPYDLPRQFTILRALENTAVRVPRALWLEDTGDVLGSPFLVMERVTGDVYEMESPAGVSDDTVVRMSRGWSNSWRRSIRWISRTRVWTLSMTAAITSPANSTTGPPRWTGPDAPPRPQRNDF